VGSDGSPLASLTWAALASTVLAALLVFAGCGTARATPEPAPTWRGMPVPPGEAIAFRALQEAVDQGDDAQASLILAGILRRAPEGETLDLAEAFGRILRGRELVRGIDAALLIENGEEGLRRIVLEVRNHNACELELRLPPVTLERLRVAIDSEGGGGRRLKTRVVDPLSELELEPGGSVRLQLSDLSSDLGGALALREVWTMGTVSGEVRTDGIDYPARALAVRSCEATLLAAGLEAGSESPQELARYLREEALDRAELVRRVVRIEPEERAEAWRLAEDWALDADPDALGVAAPALRWLRVEHPVDEAAGPEPERGFPADRPVLDLPFPSGSGADRLSRP